jgi:hypothetical protein
MFYGRFALYGTVSAVLRRIGRKEGENMAGIAQAIVLLFLPSKNPHEGRPFALIGNNM